MQERRQVISSLMGVSLVVNEGLPDPAQLAHLIVLVDSLEDLSPCQSLTGGTRNPWWHSEAGQLDRAKGVRLVERLWPWVQRHLMQHVMVAQHHLLEWCTVAGEIWDGHMRSLCP